MKQIKIKVTGQLIDDSKPTILVVTSDIKVVDEIAKEYLKAFPEMVIQAEWGYFRSYISPSKKIALGNLLNALKGRNSLNLFNY